MFPLLNCCAEVAAKRLAKLLVSLVPAGDALVEAVEFGADVWARWKKQKPSEASRSEEIQALAHASPERVEAAVQAAVQAEAAEQPAAVQRTITVYLTKLQVAVRTSLYLPAGSEGETMSADLHLNSPEDLLPFLPPFEPGEMLTPLEPILGEPAEIPCDLDQQGDEGVRQSPPPPVPRTAPARSTWDFDRQGGGEGSRPCRGVPLWVWLAGVASALVVIVTVVVVLAVRKRSRPKTPEGPPMAVKAPSETVKAPRDDDRPKGADKTKDTEPEPLSLRQRKDTEPDRKNDKQDKADTPEKPAPLPRLVAFPKLFLPERGVADLQVKVDRQGYAGPIEVQVEHLPPGVTCQRSATIPADESALRLEFRTDGTAVERTANVEVIAKADERTADRQKLALLIPPQPPPALRLPRDPVGAEKPPEPNQLKPLPNQFKNRLGMEFVRIPKGKSWLGGGKGKPGDKEVEIARDFYLGKYLVTQEEWQNVMGNNPSHFSRTGKGQDAVKGIEDADLKRFPVENVSWHDAQQFLAELNKQAEETGWVYRLPTDAEWEYACRGGPLSDKQASAFDYYLAKPTNQLLPGQANYDRDGGLRRTCKVGSYPQNPLGFYDMHGNLWEWCHDSQVNRESLRIMRGGSWTAMVEGCAASNRPDRAPSARSAGALQGDIGLRVARVPVGAERK